jgi:hypothetical protein
VRTLYEGQEVLVTICALENLLDATTRCMRFVFLFLVWPMDLTKDVGDHYKRQPTSGMALGLHSELWSIARSRWHNCFGDAVFIRTFIIRFYSPAVFCYGNQKISQRFVSSSKIVNPVLSESASLAVLSSCYARFSVPWHGTTNKTIYFIANKMKGTRDQRHTLVAGQRRHAIGRYVLFTASKTAQIRVLD